MTASNWAFVFGLLLGAVITATSMLLYEWRLK